MKPMIVAEIGGNHLGSFQRALALITSAKEAGADAVKFQCFTPEQMADPGVMIESGPWAGRELLDLYRETHTPRDWFHDLFAWARCCGLIPFASVFHPDDVDFLETLHCPIYKISSFELTDLKLIKHAASKDKLMILSTGMATWQEIEDAYWTTGTCQATFLKCTSAYPSEASAANLRAMVHMGGKLGVDVGLSDHSLTTAIPVAAAVLGASVIEKHLTINRSDGGPDASFSLEPAEFASMVRDVRAAVAALGKVTFGPNEAEISSLPFRRMSGGKRG